MIKIAMIEDDVELAQVLIEYLQRYNIQVDNYDDPFLGMSSIGQKKYDLIILDLTLPGMDGLEVCKRIINNTDIPIIISSARSDLTDKVTALELGADDYLPKPYDPKELEVRIKTILRRYNHTIVEQKISKTFELNSSHHTITKNGVNIQLTAAEYAILSLLVARSGFVVSREDIFDEVDILSSDDENSSSLSVIINRIRHKIEDNPKQPIFLQTVRGMGYKFQQ